MSARSLAEWQSLGRTAADAADRDYVVHWHSAFGVIIIEVKDGEVYVNGDRVQRADQEEET